MKPRLRLMLGLWWCGDPGRGFMWWACAFAPAEAYALWKRAQP